MPEGIVTRSDRSDTPVEEPDLAGLLLLLVDRLPLVNPSDKLLLSATG